MIVTESWNGSAWTEVSDLNTARSEFGVCALEHNTTAIKISGQLSNHCILNTNVETWDGSELD